MESTIRVREEHAASEKMLMSALINKAFQRSQLLFICGFLIIYVN